LQCSQCRERSIQTKIQVQYAKSRSYQPRRVHGVCLQIGGTDHLVSLAVRDRDVLVVGLPSATRFVSNVALEIWRTSWSSNAAERNRQDSRVAFRTLCLRSGERLGAVTQLNATDKIHSGAASNKAER
jgi:hypothetical protein